jgi:hypothetical protein
MNQLKAETEKLTILASLEGAFDAQCVDEAKRHLGTALAATKRLAKARLLTEDIELAVNETFAALRPRGWI